jgi:hypothetical protein
MICGLDDIKSTIVIFFILAFSSIIVYYFHERVQYLEQSVSRQNQVLSDFISNVQRQVVNSSHLGGSDIKIVKSDEMDKIVISEDDDSESEDDDSESEDDDSESEDDTDSESEDDSESYGNDHDIKKNIKVIELIDKEDEDENEEESHLQEMNISDTSSVSESASVSECASASAYSNSNVKKIDLTQKEDKSNEDGYGESDIVGSKKMSVAELRALVVSKGLANQNSANKMKKLELIEALGKL